MTGDPIRTRAGGPLLARRYRLLAQVGRGGMGTVWQAHDEVLGRDVAVKEVILPHGLSDDDRAVQYKRTFREARTAARLGHPGVVTVYDVVEEDGRPWIIMELIKTRSLDQVIKEDGPLKPLRAAEIGRQMLAALHAAHTAGVLHRDVKPSNVLLAAGDRAVLTDFGIAVAEGDANLTQTGLVMGSPAYIAPERARGRTAGPASDLWSLGVTLYAMVDGRSPFERSEPMAALVAIISEDPSPPISAGPLRPVIEGLLDKDPDRRMDAREAGLLLDDLVQEESENAKATHPVPPPGGRVAGDAGVTMLDAALLDNALLDHPPIGGELFGEPYFHGEGPGAGADPGATAAVDVLGDDAEADRAGRDRAGRDGYDGYDGVSATILDARVLGAESATGSRAGSSGPARSRAPEPAEAGGGPPAGSAYGPPTYVTPAGRSRTGLIILAIILTALLALGVLALLKDGQGPVGATSGMPLAGTKVGLTPSASPPGSAAASTTSRSGDAVPAGFRSHKDETGFSIVLPRDWSSPKRREGDVFFYSPDGGTYVQVGYQENANPSALDDWKRAAGSPNFAGYQEIRLEPVTRGAPVSDKTGRNAADWEFTYQGSGGRIHVLNRGLVMNGHGYAILLSAPDSDWSRTWQDLQPVYERFTPAT